MPSAVTLVRSATLSDVAEYAYAATVPAEARLIFMAGACPIDVAGLVIAPGDVREQAVQAMRNLKTALADAGAGLDDVVSTRVLVATKKQADLVTAWQVVRDAFAPHDPPSTLVGVTVLGYTNQLVEVEAVAAVVDEQPAAARSR